MDIVTVETQRHAYVPTTMDIAIVLMPNTVTVTTTMVTVVVVKHKLVLATATMVIAAINLVQLCYQVLAITERTSAIQMDCAQVLMLG